MSKCKITQQQLNDYYYGEVKNNNLQEHVVQCPTCKEYLTSLTNLDQELRLFNNEIEKYIENQFEPNLNNLFSRATEIENKKVFKETLLFGVVSLTILIIFFGIFLSWEFRFLVYLQIATYFLMPIVLLPLLKMKQEKGVN